MVQYQYCITANVRLLSYALDEGKEKEGGYEETGHANKTDYDELCSKVEELKNRKQYMDQLLSYYNVSSITGCTEFRTCIFEQWIVM